MSAQPKPGTSLRDLRGPKATVLEQIAAMEIPADLKAFLTARIGELKCDGVIVDCHFATASDTDFVQHLHLRKLY